MLSIDSCRHGSAGLYVVIRRRIWSILFTVLTVVVVVFIIDAFLETEQIDDETSSVDQIAKVGADDVSSYENDGNSIPHRDGTITQNHNSNSNKVGKRLNVFCFGDSLTAGMSPPDRTYYPYSESLATSLQNCLNEDQVSVTVDHSGYPGWMSNELLALVCPNSSTNSTNDVVDNNTNNNKECPTLMHDDIPTRIRSRLSDDVRNKLLGLGHSDDDSNNDEEYTTSVLIYLAGTNDLGRAQRTVDDIVQSITSLHLWARNVANVTYTIALSVPESAYQVRNSQAFEKANQINQKLEEFCRSTDSMRMVSSEDDPRATNPSSQQWAYYVPFPFGYASQNNNNNGVTDKNHDGMMSSSINEIAELWARDGLHFSPKGYEKLGQDLASILIETLLSDLECS